MTKRLDSGGKEVTSSRQLYRMNLDDDSYSVQDIVTFLGDSTHSLVRMNEGKSRDGIVAIVGDTMRLE